MPADPYLLTTARLGLRRYVAADLEALVPVFADPQAARFYPAMGDPGAVARWIDWNLRNYAEHGHGLWALELLENGRFIGDAGITWQTVEGEPVLEIGWHVHPDFRSRGFATEAGRACLDYGFDVLGAATLGSIVDPANAASIRVAERVHTGRREYPGKSGTMLLFHTARGATA